MGKYLRARPRGRVGTNSSVTQGRGGSANAAKTTTTFSCQTVVSPHPGAEELPPSFSIRRGSLSRAVELDGPFKRRSGTNEDLAVVMEDHR